MSLQWTPWAVVGVLVTLFVWPLAFLIYTTNPRRLQNRTLSLYLILTSTGFGIGAGWLFAAADASTAIGLQAVANVGLFCSWPIYLVFLSTLPTRRVSFLRHRPVRAGLLATSAILAAIVVLNYDRISAAPVSTPYAPFEIPFQPLAIHVLEAQVLVTASLGILAALATFAEASPGTATRRQARWYAATFVVWDTLQLIAFSLVEAASRGFGDVVAFYTIAAGVMAPAATLLFALMLSYSILKAQLFDIDLRIKWGVHRGTIAAIFLGVFLVGFAVAEQYFQKYGVIVGGLSAGLLLIAARPVERAARRMTDAAMPNVKDTTEYRTVRKRDVYSAALTEALADGELSPKDRSVLAALQDHLGISALEANHLEQRVGAHRVGRG
jgi:hypothetical protein